MSLITRLYQPGDRQSFIDLNLDWIEESFTVETSDRDQLENLESSILAKGGRIIIAELDGKVVGTGAILPPHHEPDDRLTWLEIVKMAARKDLRGRGIGRAVLESLIEQAKEMGSDAIWLETNSDLKAATILYEKCGFKTLSENELWPTPYVRCNLQMVLKF
ncbi:MAG: GNAT family N-acetyltransferase [Parasphingorhabdus sp.]